MAEGHGRGKPNSNQHAAPCGVRGTPPTVEDPERSYLWAFCDSLGTMHDDTDVTFSMCTFGAPCRKHTRMRSYNGEFPKLRHKCSTSGGSLKCGQAS